MFYIRLIFSKYFGILFLIKKCRRLDEPLNDSLNMKQTYELILSLFYTNISVSLVRPSVLRAGREIKDFQHGRTDGKKFSTDGDGRVRAARSTEHGSVQHGRGRTVPCCTEHGRRVRATRSTEDGFPSRTEHGCPSLITARDSRRVKLRNNLFLKKIEQFVRND